MRRFFLTAAAVACCAVGGLSSARAASFDILYSFCPQSGCIDGNLPAGGLLKSASGKLYGMTIDGGAQNVGTVFALTDNAGAWSFETIYTFCSKANCADGADPRNALIEDTKGNLYGVTAHGGTANSGTVFRLSHKRGKWVQSVLYSFCPQQSGCPDGNYPLTRLTYRGAAAGTPYDGKTPMFGATMLGGSAGDGAVFELKPTRRGARWIESVAYSFCGEGDCANGSSPNGLVADTAGNLFGTAGKGGDANAGTVVELTPAHAKWTATRLYSFCSLTDCKDGNGPSGPLLIDEQGELIGTAAAGGLKNSGTIFTLAPGEAGYVQSTVYSFCIDRRCNDGAAPLDGVTTDASGALVGFASAGGTNGHGGTAFRFDGTLGLLHQFCEITTCPDGRIPRGLPVFDAAGSIFGVTAGGGAHYQGEVFRITP
ncbi:MAG: hypothetical protein JOZ72_16720 [Alphaproteobacteria bacterium]|nr:hypothetical protein [Alphaproteobacteria bacterium]